MGGHESDKTAPPVRTLSKSRQLPAKVSSGDIVLTRGPEEKAPQPWPVLAEPIRSRSGRHLIPVTPSPEGDADNQAAGQRASGPRSTAGSERSYSPERRSSGRRPVASSSGSHRGVSTGSSRDAFDAAIMAARAWEAAEDDRVTSHAAAGPSRVAGQSSGAKRRAKAAASGIADLSADGGGLASAAAFADSTGEQADSTSSPAEQRGASAASAKQPPLMPQRGSPPADNTHKHNSPSAESSAATAKTPSLADRLAKQEAAIAAAAAGPVTPPKAVERQAIAVVAAVNAGAISGAVVAAAPPLVSPSPERGGDSVPAAGEGGGSAAGAGADIAPETDSSMRGFYKGLLQELAADPQRIERVVSRAYVAAGAAAGAAAGIAAGVQFVGSEIRRKITGGGGSGGGGGRDCGGGNSDM